MTTDDGYILTLHRIPGQNIAQGENGKPMKRKRKSPVFLGHSVVGSSAIWTFAPNHSLAYMLADQGITRGKFIAIEKSFNIILGFTLDVENDIFQGMMYG